MIVDAEGSGNLLYLPLNELLESAGRRAASGNQDSLVVRPEDATVEGTTSETARDRRTRQ